MFSRHPCGAAILRDQTLASGRLDRDFKDGANRLFIRGITSRISRPDFSWSPYPAFTSPLHQNDTGIGLGWIGAVRPNLTIEARAGWSADEIRFDRANNDQPGLAGPSGMLLPGSLLFYAYRNHSRNMESMGNLMWTKSRHIVKAGAGYLDRRIEGYQTAGREGYYAFPSARSIFLDQPFDVNIAVNREGSPSVVPDYDRSYRYRQWFGFFQGTWRASGRLTFNYGVRYENFGTPENVGAVKDTVVLLGPGGTLATSLAKSPGFSTPTSGNQKLYDDSDNRNWAGRAGFAYSVDRSGRFVVRGAYGLFYDRPFDNLWQTLRHNAVQLGTVFFNFGQSFNYLASPRSAPAAMTNVSRDEIFTRVSLFQPGLRTPYVQSYFLGARWFWTRNLSFEAEAFGSLGRELIATDTINRVAQPGNVLPIVSYRSNQGNSNYSAGAAVLTWRSKRQVWQASYTWSHAIDNQSDPLAGRVWRSLVYRGVDVPRHLCGLVLTGVRQHGGSRLLELRPATKRGRAWHARVAVSLLAFQSRFALPGLENLVARRNSLRVSVHDRFAFRRHCANRQQSGRCDKTRRSLFGSHPGERRQDLFQPGRICCSAWQPSGDLREKCSVRAGVLECGLLARPEYHRTPTRRGRPSYPARRCLQRGKSREPRRAE